MTGDYFLYLEPVIDPLTGRVARGWWRLRCSCGLDYVARPEQALARAIRHEADEAAACGMTITKEDDA